MTGYDLNMFAIAAAVLFVIALLLDLADKGVTYGVSALVIAGLLGLALHQAGFSDRVQRGQWRTRGRWSRRR
ncbi:hypothetical protein [Nocardia pseudobrasiliensis]|uniref:hypothetical protein n=1 Tax=Nocardia pseudobrasiliensis TaxID=45979 RepID=UPI000835AA04|nr:hypothetical protein [Nocardia pseudobrasiliensis]